MKKRKINSLLTFYQCIVDSLQFTQFNTEKDLDVVEFFDGSPALKDGRCLSRLSGSLPESYQVFLSSNNFMNVRFTSDSSRQQSGFKFTWRTSMLFSYSRYISSTNVFKYTLYLK